MSWLSINGHWWPSPAAVQRCMTKSLLTMSLNMGFQQGQTPCQKCAAFFRQWMCSGSVQAKRQQGYGCSHQMWLHTAITLHASCQLLFVMRFGPAHVQCRRSYASCKLRTVIIWWINVVRCNAPVARLHAHAVCALKRHKVTKTRQHAPQSCAQQPQCKRTRHDAVAAH